MRKNKNKRPNKSTLGITYRGVTVVNNETRSGGLRTRFRARIGSDPNRLSLGYYDTPEEAAMAYNKASKKVFRTERLARAKGRWNDVTA